MTIKQAWWVYHRRRVSWYRNGAIPACVGEWLDRSLIVTTDPRNPGGNLCWCMILTTSGWGYDDMTPASNLLIHHLWLRRFLGILGLLLPFILIFGNWVKFEETIGMAYGWSNVQDSISAYYTTQMRNIFVAIMCSVGCFLLAYKGYSERGVSLPFCRWLPESNDNVVTSFAGAFAIGVALFPSSSIHTWVQFLHYFSAAAMLTAFGYISLCLFTKTSLIQPTMPTGKKLRNAWFIVSGLIILACVLLLFIYVALN